MTDSYSHSNDLQLAHEVADALDRLTMSRFRASDLAVEAKPDLTPVTDADRGAEQLAREILGRERPSDSVLGEEHGVTGSGSRQWVLDPIDGTKNFVRGVPVWASLIALLENGSPLLGVVSAPALGRRWWAVTGGGAWAGPSAAEATRLSVSRVQRLADASLSYSDLVGWEHRPDGTGTLLRLVEECWRSRAYGDFWHYMLLAEGALDIACEPQLELYDLAALVPIVREAGGTFTDMDGDARVRAGSVLATNTHLHQAALRVLGP